MSVLLMQTKRTRDHRQTISDEQCSREYGAIRRDYTQRYDRTSSACTAYTLIRRLLVVPRYRLSTYGRRAFAVAGPSVWNSLPDNLRDSAVGSDSFRRSLKTFLFATYWDMQRIRGSTRMRYINLLLLTYLLTYYTVLSRLAAGNVLCVVDISK